MSNYANYAVGICRKDTGELVNKVYFVDEKSATEYFKYNHVDDRFYTYGYSIDTSSDSDDSDISYDDILIVEL